MKKIEKFRNTLIHQVVQLIHVQRTNIRFSLQNPPSLYLESQPTRSLIFRLFSRRIDLRNEVLEIDANITALQLQRSQ